MRWFPALAIAVTLLGCGKAKPGDTCDNPECADSKTGYSCENGVYREIPCRGPQGCTTTSTTEVLIVCDESLDVAGDGCAAQEIGAVMCENEPNALVCSGSPAVWTNTPCAGGCTSGPPSVGVCTP